MPTLTHLSAIQVAAPLPASIQGQPQQKTTYQFQSGLSAQLDVGTDFVISIYPGLLNPLQCMHNGIFTYVVPPAQKNKVIHRKCNPLILSSSRVNPMTNAFANQIANLDPYTDIVVDAPAGTLGYSILQVFDTWLLNRNWEANTIEYTPMPFSANQVARGLITDWNRGLMAMNFGFAPGIAQVSIETLCDQTKLNAVIEQLRGTQEAMFMAWVKEATEFAGRREFQQITERHHLAAAWLGIEDRDVHVWLRPLQEKAMKSCPACSEQIGARALKCQKCGQNLVEWYSLYPHLIGEDIAVAAFIANIPKQAAPKTPAPPSQSAKGQ